MSQAAGFNYDGKQQYDRDCSGIVIAPLSALKLIQREQ
jgi:hypothetical protein